MALQALEDRSSTLFEAARRRRPFHDLLGWVLLATVSLFLWSWFAVEVVAPLASTQAGYQAGREAVAGAESTRITVVQAAMNADAP